VRRRVAVIGDIMLDVVVRPDGPLAPTSDTPSSIRVSRGGSGANVALALRTSGHQVHYIGAVGDDPARHIFQMAMNAAGIALQLRVVEQPTGTVVALVADDGQRMMLTDRGANAFLDEASVDEFLKQPYDHLHVSGYLLLDSATRHVAEHALLKAQHVGSSTSIDVCSVAPLREVTPEVFLGAATSASKIFANEEEALALTSAATAGEALESLSSLFHEVMITLGPRGALASWGDKRYSVDALDVEVVDTTGAGDAATGAYLGARLYGDSPDRSLQLAMEAAATVIGGLGALG
jgi:sugar/nucleoside kinase (ribokinase family)